MKLITALRLQKGTPRVAFVGAGGKTTAMFALAHELVEGQDGISGFIELQRGRVIVTATTHLSASQAGFADRCMQINRASDLEPYLAELPPGITLIMGPAQADERLQGLQGESLAAVWRLAEHWQIPLLVEADGSRQKPVKAPAEHEPVIPDWTELVVVTAGLSAIGRPLSNEWVHRPERFAEITAQSPGAFIDRSNLVRVLSHDQGGLKGIKSGMRRVVLLNQADTAEMQAQGKAISKELVPCFDGIAIASFRLGVTEETGPVVAMHEKNAGIILAAGSSSRLGQPKQLLDWQGEPLLRWVVKAALQAGLAPVHVVTGAFAQAVETALDGLEVVITLNPAWEAGQGTSVAAGVRSLPKEVGAALFLLCDQPQVGLHLIQALVEQHAQTLAPIVAPLVDGVRANPVLFDQVTFPDLVNLRADIGGRSLFSRYPVSFLPWQDPAVLLDIDTLEDYQRMVGK
jgi:molybdenum cofactor cytidylyltransferase